MAQYGLPVLYTLFVWWFSTGIILYLDGLPRHTFRWSMLGATALLLIACYGLALSSTDTSLLGAYTAFTCGVLVWAWVEMSFLMGFITGSWRSACPPDCGEWRRFFYAVQAILYHELVIIALLIAITALTWNAANQIGMWTFLTLWLMRLSTKLNLFLGVRNLSEEFLPEHLHYLKSFFIRKPMNLLFPFSVTLGTIIAVLLVLHIPAAATSAFNAVGLTLIATLLILAILEHWFLVLPLPFEALWRWGLKSREVHHQVEQPKQDDDHDSLQTSGRHPSPQQPVAVKS